MDLFPQGEPVNVADYLLATRRPEDPVITDRKGDHTYWTLRMAVTPLGQHFEYEHLVPGSRGYTVIVDRQDDFIKSWGFRVSSRKAEDAIVGMHDIAAAAVVGRPDRDALDANGKVMKSILRASAASGGSPRRRCRARLRGRPDLKDAPQTLNYQSPLTDRSVASQVSPGIAALLAGTDQQL